MFETPITKTEKKYGDDKIKSRAALIRIAGVTGILANVLFAAMKFVIGTAANSIAITSDAVNNLTDASSSIITLAGLKLSQKPADRKHPLGYGRIEYISGLIVAAIVLITGVEFFQTSVGRIADPEPVDFSVLQLVLLGVFVVGKLILGRLDKEFGLRSKSGALVASGTDARMDALVSTLTIITAVITMATGIVIDGYAGVAMSLFIMFNGISLIKDTVNSIIGSRADKKVVDEVKADILGIEPIRGAYDMIIHNYGPATQLGTLNLEMPDYTTVEQAYMAMEQAQRKVYQKHHIYFTFGLYSVNTYDDDVISARDQVTAIVKGTEGAISIHAFNYDKNNKLIRFDIIVDFGVHDFMEFRNKLIRKLSESYPGFTFDINVDLDYA